uniref:Globin n=1 Tax=Polypedilum nubifer TaxID=54969 RepID=V5YMG1_9DIPT|nr:globin [Polypedilum nubifer]
MKLLIVVAALIAAAQASVDAGEAALIKSTWNQVKTNEVDILYAIFSAYPDIQAKFPAFVGKDLDSLKGSAPFALHASRIVSLISQYVGLLGNDANEPAIQTIFSQMGQTHYNRGVSQQQFTEFRTAFFNYMKGHVSFDAATETAWNDAFDQMFGYILAKY